MSGSLDGYCFRGSIAHILNIDIDEVPYLDPPEDGSYWLDTYREWIKERGGDVLGFWFNGSWKLQDLLDWWCWLNPNRAAILHGYAGREDHAVVVQDGKIVYNTSPADELKPSRAEKWPDGVWFFYVVTKNMEIS